MQGRFLPMSDSQSIGREPSLRQSLGLDRHPLTRTKIFVLGVAILMMILGLVLAVTAERAPTPAGDPEATSPALPGLGQGFAPSRTGNLPSSQPAEARDGKDGGVGLNDLSPFMVRGGFGLFIGFAIGFAMRAFLRLAVVIIGFYLLVLSMMAYVGWIEIHWTLMEDQFTGLLGYLGSQFESFQSFLTGAIPASGLTATGFVFGLRRR
jgi:uncharacterized membrane protein (Fun14 family)